MIVDGWMRHCAGIQLQGVQMADRVGDRTGGAALLTEGRLVELGGDHRMMASREMVMI